MCECRTVLSLTLYFHTHCNIQSIMYASLFHCAIVRKQENHVNNTHSYTGTHTRCDRTEDGTHAVFAYDYYFIFVWNSQSNRRYSATVGLFFSEEKFTHYHVNVEENDKTRVLPLRWLRTNSFYTSVCFSLLCFQFACNRNLYANISRWCGRLYTNYWLTLIVCTENYTFDIQCSWTTTTNETDTC